MVYHVAYDLNKPGQHYDKVIAEIERKPHIKILMSSWLVDTTESAQQLRKRLRTVTDSNDRCFVSEVEDGCYAGWLSRASWRWLEARVL